MTQIGRTARRPRPRLAGSWKGALAALALALAATLTRVPPASAYVQYQVMDDNGQGTGVFFHWSQACVPVTAYTDGFTDMTPAQVALAATSAAEAWSRDQLSCTFLDIQVSLSSDPPHPVGSDAFNVLVFKRPWCDTSRPGSCEPSALAITSVWANRKTGVIHDGDIEVNADPSLAVWADLDLDPEPWKNDLQNALTHEMGHLIGLDHNCYSPSQATHPMLDNRGVQVPACATAPDDVQAATMYNSAKPGDVEKRTLSPDDAQAVCDIYPVNSDPGTCPLSASSAGAGDSSGACTYASVPNGGSRAGALATLLALAALMFLFVTRRRPRRRCS
jgi:hypothetical protein